MSRIEGQQPMPRHTHGVEAAAKAKNETPAEKVDLKALAARVESAVGEVPKAGRHSIVLQPGDEVGTRTATVTSALYRSGMFQIHRK
jgi:hypothetical protein